MIEVQHLTKRYGRVTAVDDVSFRVERGEILGFLGPNGAGKTTTMRVLTGYMPPTEGTAVVAGFDVFEQPIEAKRRTGYLPETPPLYPDMTVREYLTFVARIKGVPRRASARRASRQVDGDARASPTWRTAHCGKLSKGYRQRVGLAQALLHNPEVLILDEPTAGLDPKQIIETRAAHQGAGRRPHDHPEHAHPARGRADLPARRHHQQGPGGGGRHARQPDAPAERLGDDVRAGRRAGPTPTDALQARAPASRAWPWPTSTAASSGYEVESERGRDIRRDLARAVVDGGWGLLELRPMRMSLEEIFLQLTTERSRPEEADGGGQRMRNILAIAQQGTARRTSRRRSPTCVIGFFALLFGYFFIVDPRLLRAAGHAGRHGHAAGSRSTSTSR